MKVLKFPAQRINRKEPAVPKKRRKRNIIEKMIRKLEPAMRVFPHMHGALPADLAQIDKRLLEAVQS
jgi:hypothetical protein